MIDTHHAPDGSDGGLHHDPMEVAPDSIFSSVCGRWHRHDQCSQQYDQFKQSMNAVNNSLIDLLQCQQRIQDDSSLL